MKYPLATDSWNWKEKLAILKVMVGGRYTMGSHVANFEKEFADKMGSRNAVMVNSGSSANLVGLHALVLKKKIKPGSEVIVPAVSWSTTYFPITQLGLVPVFVDIDLDTFNLDIKNIIPAITSKTCAVLAVVWPAPYIYRRHIVLRFHQILYKTPLLVCFYSRICLSKTKKKSLY